MDRKIRRSMAAACGLLSLALVASACSSSDDKDSGSTGGGQTVDAGFKIGLLLPESKTTRYETFDKPLIEAKLKELCPKCEVLYQNADQDSAKQQSQAEAMLTQGAKVLILDAVDAKAAGGIVTNAKGQNVPVVAYDRLATGPVSFYVSFDNKKVGQVQGQALLDVLTKGGDPKRADIVMINGSPTDPNAADFKAGAHSVLDGKVNIGKEYDTPDWSPDKAQDQMTQAITALGKDKIIGVYAANDGTAGGAIAAMKSGGFTTIPPTTGQDAELAAIQRIVAGDQYMTVYKAIKPEAEIAAAMAIAAATGKDYVGEVTVKVNNGTQDVTSVLLTPVSVTKENLKDTIVKDGVYTVAQICTSQYAAACTAAGIS
ncbi:D-xylose transport system substrate-binding protein [Allocatelliglobosispora scoriae]|uniref:D-xylose transport system substrate-binding protein n=1 Tax=Allocatelliglobosispora scoriae TaxID=643052 RepID=A0A841BL69_9ACTN|nr:sugar ABC transporter substrate-binding protein [Allocatelliglobosispora scoriae]MBB5867611.1 D-xylose transport system substrate-binding protein [Allocatelliglobosispora scoriae]